MVEIARVPAHADSLEPRISVLGDEIEVDGHSYPLQPGDALEVRQYTEWELPALGMVAGAMLLLMSAVLYFVGAGAFFFTIAAMGGAALIALSWVGTGYRKWVYELVLRHGEHRVVIAQSNTPDPIYRAQSAFGEVRG